MPTDSGTNDILSLGFLHYTTAVSREMSDEPDFLMNCPPIKLRKKTAVRHKMYKENQHHFFSYFRR